MGFLDISYLYLVFFKKAEYFLPLYRMMDLFYIYCAELSGHLSHVNIPLQWWWDTENNKST